MENGIPVFDSSESPIAPGYRLGEPGKKISIWLDYQYDDAMALLRDPDNYVVKNPVDLEEFEQIQNQVSSEMDADRKEQTEKLMNRLVIGGGIVLAGIGLYFVLSRA